LKERKDIIIYYGHAEFPDKNALAHRVIANAKILEKIGYKVILIGGDRSLAMEKDILDTKSSVHSFDYYSYRYPQSFFEWLRHMTSISPVKRVCEQFPGRVKYIIFTGIGFLNTIKLLNYGRKMKIAIISDTVDWFSRSNDRFPISIIKNIDTFLNMHIAKPLVKNIICISSFLKSFYKKKHCNVLLLPSLIDNNDPKYNSHKYIPSEDNVKFFYAGSPGTKERMDYVVRAVNELINEGFRVSLDICGISKDEFIKKYGIDTLFNEEKIKFYGRLPNSICLKMIQESDFCTFAREVSLANSAGFPTKFSESLACGTPVVTTPTSDIKDHLKNGYNGFLAEDCSYESYLNAMRLAAETSLEDRKRMHIFCKENRTLHYMNYVEQMKLFINELDNYD
jgi:glycosyltransferase involved in cell wall biosynthesis